jgi:chorismate dehydratase
MHIKNGMEKIRISAVRYANTYPFIYGLYEDGLDRKAIIETDHPSDCAAKLIADRVDIGLIPVAAIPLLKESHIVGDYCIGANQKVRTVQLMSNTEFRNIDTVYLDYRSRTSVNLVKVLAKNKWKKEFRWVSTDRWFDFVGIKPNEGVVLIGDQCFEFENCFSYRYDLAEEWIEFTDLPFVFACWTSNKILDSGFVRDFNNALEKGVKNIDLVVEKYGNTGSIRGEELKKYLTENIDFRFNEDKKKGLDLFLTLLKKI